MYNQEEKYPQYPPLKVNNLFSGAGGKYGFVSELPRLKSSPISFFSKKKEEETLSNEDWSVIRDFFNDVNNRQTYENIIEELSKYIKERNIINLQTMADILKNVKPDELEAMNERLGEQAEESIVMKIMDEEKRKNENIFNRAFRSPIINLRSPENLNTFESPTLESSYINKRKSSPASRRSSPTMDRFMKFLSPSKF